MKKVLVAALAALSISLLGTSAAAATKEEIGPRINVLTGTPTTFPAGVPFHVHHGFGWGVGIETFTPPAGGVYSFALDVDGVPRAEDFVIRETFPPPATGLDFDLQARTWVFNFPAGMTGAHTFTGHWFQPCGAAVAGPAEYPGPCKDPAESVEVITSSLTVTFTP
jgi:hypothetical protein